MICLCVFFVVCEIDYDVFEIEDYLIVWKDCFVDSFFCGEEKVGS